MFFLFALLRAPVAKPELRDEDSALLAAVARGQSAALGTLYDRYGRLVYSLAYHVTSDDGAAEEITQEVFLQVWHKAASYQADLGKVSTWLTSIARHRAIDSLRRRSSRPEGHRVDWEESEDGEEPELVDPLQVEAQVESSLENSSLRRAIAALPQEQRHTLALAYFNGLSHQEISDLTGEPLGTVKTRIRLAMTKLRQLLEV